MSGEARDQWLARIRANIEAHGHHVTVVAGSDVPRFAYTIGLLEPLGRELVLAGGAALSEDEAGSVLNEAAAQLRRGAAGDVRVDGVGSFAVRPVDRSWVVRLMFGATDVAGTDDLDALQLVPLGELGTIDVPDLAAPFDTEREPIWRWLDDTWDLDVPQTAAAVTNLDALRGAPLTEAARWEPGQWELFAGAGPDVPREDLRIVPLWTLVGSDPSARPVLHLAVGDALWREPPGDWQVWGSSGAES